MTIAMSQTLTERAPDENSRTRVFGVGNREASTSRSDDIGAKTSDSDICKSVDVAPSGAPVHPSTLSFSSTRLADEFFKAIRNWEGVVERIENDRFFAIVRDTDKPDDKGDEQFEIDLEDVSEGDRDLVVPGAIFYLTVGYRVRRGQRFKGTQIVFRRMPRWSKKDIARVNSRADRLLEIVRGAKPVERTG